jgi:hypothetical protein
LTQAKISSFKNPHIKIRPIRGQHPLTVIPYNESKHNILALVGENNKGRIMSILSTSILHKRIFLLPFCGVKEVSLPFRVLLDF